ncbi:hypothetical protein [Bradyrhizobium genosp. P]|uniref:hypothetical protein n=1 Tax=Bradyrhizobium genosp. P TaxID=83641 RepID=UPI003CEC811A
MITKEVLSVEGRPKFSTSLEGYYSMAMHVMVWFGRWQDIIEASMPGEPDLYPVRPCITTKMRSLMRR